uniref:(northern house mosquito) hypothetical protein n=1 Tax=Culex pipiens TaxID=7175 RepID=A0A8D8B9Y9_CULPI
MRPAGIRSLGTRSGRIRFQKMKTTVQRSSSRSTNRIWVEMRAFLSCLVKRRPRRCRTSRPRWRNPSRLGSGLTSSSNCLWIRRPRRLFRNRSRFPANTCPSTGASKVDCDSCAKRQSPGITSEQTRKPAD